jgi:CheY-like chemotaxis protein
VVEDEPVVRRMAEWILGKARYSVIGATRGREAIEICEGREQPIDLLLTDVNMPGMLGTELVEKVHGIRPGLRVLYMSGSSPEAIVPQKLGGNDSAFIAKPFSALALLAIVAELLDKV